MALIENTVFGDYDKVAIAIERIRQFEPKDSDTGYCVAISGGKDSTVIYDLVHRAGVRAHYTHSFTTIDAPQTVRYVKKYQPDAKFIYPAIRPLQAMMLIWKEPPTQLWRVCCRHYKETACTGEFTITGVRKEESTRRGTKKMVETCARDVTKHYLHPIIDWTESDVWEYIHNNKLPYNPLYDPPYNLKRVGCVMCPCSAHAYEEGMMVAPRIVASWKRWIWRLHAKAVEKKWTLAKHYETAEDLWKWWLGKKEFKDKDQLSIFED